MSRLDTDRVAPGSLVKTFLPVWREHPSHLPLALSVGLALVHDGRPDEGIDVLRDALRRFPGSAEAWDAWLTALEDSYRPELLKEEFDRVPTTLANDHRFARHEGDVAQQTRDWPRAVNAYRRAHEFEPFNAVVLYRFWTALRAVGATDEFRRVDRLLVEYRSAFQQLRPVYVEARAIRTLGLEPRPELYHRLAGLRERMGRFDEARAWHSLVLRDAPNDAQSLTALARLQKP
jgi:tetratricopeptide (TPR) repeat protein